MTTVLEIQEPKMSYCKKYDIHCECPKCKKHTSGTCFKFKFLSWPHPTGDYCTDICMGPKKPDENKDFRCNII